MFESRYSDEYNRAKDFYFKIGKIKSTSFSDEEIEFNAVGWRHILIKNGEPRPNEDRLRRFAILKFAEVVIKRGEVVHYTHSLKNGSPGKFWRMEKIIQGVLYKVVLRKIGGGELHFYSIMN